MDSLGQGAHGIHELPHLGTVHLIPRPGSASPSVHGVPKCYDCTENTLPALCLYQFGFGGDWNLHSSNIHGQWAAKAFAHCPFLISETKPKTISVGFLRGDKNYLSASTGLSLQYIFIRCKYIYIYIILVKTYGSLTIKIHAQLWCGNVGITDSSGQSWRIHFHCHTRIWGLIFQWRPLVPVSPKHSHPGLVMAWWHCGVCSHGLTLELCWCVHLLCSIIVLCTSSHPTVPAEATIVSRTAPQIRILEEPLKVKT